MSSEFIKMRELIKKVLREKNRELAAGKIVQDDLRKNHPPQLDDEVWIDTKVSSLEGFVLDLEGILTAMNCKPEAQHPCFGECSQLNY